MKKKKVHVERIHISVIVYVKMNITMIRLFGTIYQNNIIDHPQFLKVSHPCTHTQREREEQLYFEGKSNICQGKI